MDLTYVVMLVKNWLGIEEEEGQGLVEYGLIIVLVSIAVFAALQALGGQLNTTFNTIANNLKTS